MRINNKKLTKIISYIYLLGGAFFSYNIVVSNSIMISDLFLLIIIMINLFYIKKFKNIKVRYYIIFFVFILVSILSFYFNFFKEYFNYIEFFKSFLKLVFYFIFLFSIKNIHNYFDKKEFIKTIFYVSYILAILGVIQYMILIFFNFNIFYVEHFSIFEPFNTIRFNFFRLKGIFGESSWYSLYQLILMSIFLYLTKNKINFLKFLVIITSLILTFSLSGWIVVFFLVLYYLHVNNFNFKNKLLIIILLSYVIFLFFNSNISQKKTMVNRIKAGYKLEDNSIERRFGDSFKKVKMAMNNNILFGYGLGNSDQIPNKGMKLINRQVPNILASIMINFGISGLFLYLILVVYFLKKSLYLGICFMFFSFGIGIFLGAIFWIYISLILYAIENRRSNNEIKINIYNK